MRVTNNEKLKMILEHIEEKLYQISVNDIIIKIWQKKLS